LKIGPSSPRTWLCRLDDGAARLLLALARPRIPHSGRPLHPPARLVSRFLAFRRSNNAGSGPHGSVPAEKSDAAGSSACRGRSVSQNRSTRCLDVGRAVRELDQQHLGRATACLVVASPRQAMTSSSRVSSGTASTATLDGACACMQRLDFGAAMFSPEPADDIFLAVDEVAHAIGSCRTVSRCGTTTRAQACASPVSSLNTLKSLAVASALMAESPSRQGAPAGTSRSRCRPHASMPVT